MQHPFDPQAALLGWYALHQRDLPWRREPTPYRVLVSELMLQQTQVDRVIPYFERFIARFPSIAALAAAPRSDVIEAWAGLGYNRRAVYLHELARQVVDRFDGTIPDDLESLRTLPGIGEYTAGAVLSIGFGRDAIAMDTNAERVLARFGFEGSAARSEVRARAWDLLPRGRARDWNQALMDLGSTFCAARAPRCLLCPLQSGCLSAGAPVAAVRRHETTPFQETTRYFRGRMLAALRDLGAGESAPLSQVAASLRVQGVAEPPIGWDVIGAGLARDGLASIQPPSAESPEPLIGLPQ